MLMKIKDKEYEVKFSIKFIRELDKKYTVKGGNGMTYGASLDHLLPCIFTGDVAVLAEMLYAGTANEKRRPSQGDVDAFVEEHEDIEALIVEVQEELKKQNATKMKALQWAKAMAPQ